MARRSKYLAKCQVSKELPWTLGDMVLIEVLAGLRCSTRLVADILDRPNDQVAKMRIAMGLPPAQASLFEARKMTADEWEKLAAMHAAGSYISEISRRLRAGHYVVVRWLDELGLKPNCYDPKARVRRRDARIVELRKAKHSFREIARLMDQKDCTVGAVAGACYRAGLCKPKKGKQRNEQRNYHPSSSRQSSESGAEHIRN